MNRASSATGWVRNPVMKSPNLDSTQASSYELGWTYNPITGCRNQVNGLCKGGGFPCYAYKLANGRLKQRYLANDNITTTLTGSDLVKLHKAYSDPFYPRFWPERLLQPWDLNRKWKPKGIFVCDMGELFGDWIPEQWQEEVFKVIKNNNQHRFYLLTKQPQNLIKFSPFPENCWVGVTATDTSMAWIASKHLSQIEAKAKFLSIEPLLSWKTSTPYTTENIVAGLNGNLDWVIIGAQTKPTVYPKIEWVEEIVRACDKAGIPVFLKDNLAPLISQHTILTTRLDDWANRSAKVHRMEYVGGVHYYRLRQEIPE